MRRFNFGKKEDTHEGKNLVPFGGFDLFDNIFEGFFEEPFKFGFGLLGVGRKPVFDIYEKDNKVVVKSDLPGMDKKDIDIHLDNNILTISGNKKLEREVKKDSYCHLERNYGAIQRSIRLPYGLTEKDVKATYRDGVLTIEIPKSGKDIQKGKRIDIE